MPLTNTVVPKKLPQYTLTITSISPSIIPSVISPFLSELLNQCRFLPWDRNPLLFFLIVMLIVVSHQGEEGGWDNRSTLFTLICVPSGNACAVGCYSINGSPLWPLWYHIPIKGSWCRTSFLCDCWVTCNLPLLSNPPSREFCTLSYTHCSVAILTLG